MPESFFSFFIASTGAAAALVGLLFVAISIAPEHIVADTAPMERQTGAASAFTALFDALFVSLVALIPKTNIGGVGLTMGIIGLVNSVGIALQVVRRQRAWRAWVRGGFLLLASFVVYGLQSWYSIALLRDYRDLGAVFVLAFLMIVAYGIGISRAWELLGARRYGLGSFITLVLNIGARDLATPPAATQSPAPPAQPIAAPTVRSTATPADAHDA